MSSKGRPTECGQDGGRKLEPRSEADGRGGLIAHCGRWYGWEGGGVVVVINLGKMTRDRDSKVR